MSSALRSAHCLLDFREQLNTLGTTSNDSKPWNLHSETVSLIALNTLKTTLKPHSAAVTVVLNSLPMSKNRKHNASTALELVCSHHTLFCSSLFMYLLWFPVPFHLNLFPTMLDCGGFFLVCPTNCNQWYNCRKKCTNSCFGFQAK